MNRFRNLFGEPVAIVGAVQAILIMLVSFGDLDWLGLHTQNDVMTVVAVLTALGAVYLAWSTHRTLLAPVIELFKAGVAVAAIYGFQMSTEHVGIVITAFTAFFALIHQSQTSPIPTPAPAPTPAPPPAA